MNLFCILPNEVDATSFYRALQPIVQLRKIIPDLRVSFPMGGQVKESDLANSDVVFFQRPDNEVQLGLVELCKALKVKVWLDYDDNLFTVPKNNPAHEHYSKPETQKNMRRMIELTDALSVSTRSLAEAIGNDSRDVHIIPNAHNDYLFNEEPVFSDHKHILWRGTNTHQEDLFALSGSIFQAAKQYPQWMFHFMGYDPFYLRQLLGEQAIHWPHCGVLDYFDYLKKLRPNIVYATLSNNEFNQSKSNILWLEATYAGAVTLAPDLEEWRKPGVTLYKDQPDFQGAMEFLLRQKSEVLKEKHQQSVNYIKENLMLSKVNQMRKNLLEGLR